MALDTEEKAINNSNNGDGKISATRLAKIQELQQLAQKAILAKDYEEASKLYYEISRLDHKDILSKYLYELSFQLVPLTNEQKQIYTEQNSATPEYMEIDRLVKRKEKRAFEVCVQLIEYCLEQKIDFQADKLPDLLNLIQLLYNKRQFSEDVWLLHKALAPYLETNEEARRLATQLADKDMNFLAKGCQQGLDAVKQTSDQYTILYIRDMIAAPLKLAKKLQEFYPDIHVPEAIKQAEEWYNKEEIRNINNASIILSGAEQMVQQKKEEMAREAKEREERVKKPLFTNYELWAILLVLLALYYFLA